MRVRVCDVQNVAPADCATIIKYTSQLKVKRDDLGGRANGDLMGSGKYTIERRVDKER